MHYQISSDPRRRLAPGLWGAQTLWLPVLRGLGCCILAICVLVAGVLAAGLAQAQIGPNVTVQLPTFHQFGVSTTVVVPDRGTALLGGVGYSSLGRSRAGLPFIGSRMPGRRSLGRTSHASNLALSATIIDLQAMDRALLATAARRRGAQFDIEGRPVTTTPSRLPAVNVPRARANSWRVHEASTRDGRNSLAPPHFRRTR